MKYWVIIDKEQKGPFTIDEMRSLPLEAQTPVWHKGMADWAPLISRPELMELISGSGSAPAANATAGAPATIVAPAGSIPPGYVVVAPSAEARRPSSYFILSIVLIFFGVLIFSLISLFFGWRVRKALNAGDWARAHRASERAALFNIINIVVTLIMIPFGVVIEMIDFSLF